MMHEHKMTSYEYTSYKRIQYSCNIAYRLLQIKCSYSASMAALIKGSITNHRAPKLKRDPPRGLRLGPVYLILSQLITTRYSPTHSDTFHLVVGSLNDAQNVSF